MKKLLIITASVFLIPFCYAQTSTDYLGQTLPGTTPLKFNLSVSAGYNAAERVAISNDRTEIYYSELNGYNATSKSRVKYYNYSEGKWNGPKVLFENFVSPTLSIDGKKMFLQKMSVLSTEVWCSVKTDTGWSKPTWYMPSQPVDYLLWETNNGSLYFGSSTAKDGLGQRDWSKLIITGNDTIVQSLGAPLCTSGDDVDFGISRNDSVIIIAAGTSTNRKANGKLDLFVSYKKNDGSWTNPKNLGPKININDPNDGRWAPCFTADNKYLFYTGGWNSPAIYWVEIGNLIDSLKKTNFSPYLKTPLQNQADTIGHSFNYTFPEGAFTDEDGNNTITYSATLSNGKPLPKWLTFNNTSRTFSATLDSAGTFNIKVIATDKENASVSTVFLLNVIGKPTSVKQSLNENIQLYPNPTNGMLKISFGKSSVNQAILGVFNLDGKQIVSKKYQNTPSATIDLDGYAKGIYVVKVIADGASYEEKIVKE